MKLSTEQAAALAGTRAADAAGRPLVLHHGTHHRFDRFEQTRDLGFHFGSRAQAEKRLRTLTGAERRAAGGGPARIVSVALASRSPLLLPDDPLSWQPHYMADIFGRFLAPGEKAALTARGGKPEDKHAVMRGALARAGHDAIVYRNQVESASGSRCIEWSWLALDPRIIVDLGGDVRAGLAEWPEGLSGSPGFDPDAETRRIGGLRRRDMKLASVREMRAFRDTAVAICSGCIEAESARDPSFMKACRDIKGRLHGVPIEVDVNGDVGRIRIRVNPAPKGDAPPTERPDAEAVSAAIAHLGDEEGFLLGPSARCAATFDTRWVPGEAMGTSMDRLQGILSGLSDALVALTPAAPRP